MNKPLMLKKSLPILVVGILVLSGVGVSAITSNKAAIATHNKAIMENHPPDAPVINALTIEKNEINEVNDNALSDQDLAELENVWINLADRFEDAETQEEEIAILKEIPIIMDRYGLLPEDMTVEEAQKLIVTSYLETIVSSSLQSDKQSKVVGDSPLAVSKSVFPSNSAQFQDLESNLIVNNNIKLNPPQPAPWPPNDKIIVFGYGRISNLHTEWSEWYKYYVFNCENVICITGINDAPFRFHRWTNDEESYLPFYCHGIVNDNFIFALIFW